MQSTFTELALTPVYRLAQRSLAAWLEQGQGNVRQLAFRVRQALVGLDPVDEHRMARWLAWLALAERSQGRKGLDARVRQLDSGLYRRMQETLAHLPAAPAAVAAARRLSA